MSLHKEISFELEICQHLASTGWLYAEGDAAGYDRARALFPADVLAWVQATQPKAWEVLAKNHGGKAAETLLTRLRDQLDQRGTLDVLRHGIELLGLKTPLLLAQFKPALAINRALPLGPGEAPKLPPMTEAGTGSVQEQQKVYMAVLIEKLNDLFGAETSEQDQLRYVNGTILGKVAESATLQQQAANNTKEQFANSPDLSSELQNAIIESYDAHTAMSTQALNSPIVLRGLLDILLNHSGLYETLRERADQAGRG